MAIGLAFLVGLALGSVLERTGRFAAELVRGLIGRHRTQPEPQRATPAHAISDAGTSFVPRLRTARAFRR